MSKRAKALADRIAEARREVDSDLRRLRTPDAPSAPEVAKFTANTAQHQPSPA